MPTYVDSNASMPFTDGPTTIQMARKCFQDKLGISDDEWRTNYSVSASRNRLQPSEWDIKLYKTRPGGSKDPAEMDLLTSGTGTTSNTDTEAQMKISYKDTQALHDRDSTA
jgi:hypothetical protein